MLLCPICKGTLTRQENTLRCDRGHSYDFAKEGYVNLLLANQKASLSPGDTKEMALARRRFLEKGYYAPLSDRINNIIASHLDTVMPEGKAAAILDIGCGEGYYLARLQRSLRSDHKRTFADASYGMDISKEAVKLAARTHKDIRFFIGSLHQTFPFGDAALDVLLNVFAPRNPLEFSRVLRPNGLALAVIPAAGHLNELHEAFGTSQIKGEKDQQIAEAFRGALFLSRVETLRYRRTVDAEGITDLIRMTPTSWHLSKTVEAKAKSIPNLDINFAFLLVSLVSAAPPPVVFRGER